MGFGLRTLNRLAGSELLDRIGIRKQVERARLHHDQERIPHSHRGRAHLQGGAEPRQTGAAGTGKSHGLFDITPDDEQQMFQEAVRAFAEEKVRPAAQAADADCATPPELLAQANELGINMLGVPEEQGGVVGEQAAVSSVLIGEALAHGDLGHRLRGARSGCSRHGDRPLGDRGPAGDLPALLHGRGRARRGAGDPRAASSLRPVQAGDQGAPRRRGLGPRRRQVAGPAAGRLRAVRRSRRGRGAADPRSS